MNTVSPRVGRATSALQVVQYREVAAIVVLRWRQAQLGEDAGDVLLDRTLAHHEPCRDGGVLTVPRP